MAVSRVHIAISVAAGNRLATAGVTPGWLFAWLRSAGCTDVTYGFQPGNVVGEGADREVTVVAPDELACMRQRPDARAGHDHSRATCASDCDGYIYRNNKGIERLVIATDEIVRARRDWLSVLAGGRALRALHVWIGDDARGIELEPGLRADTRPAPAGALLLNGEGLMPEEQLLRLLVNNRLRVRFAESCTAGGMCERLGRVPGASAVLDCGWVVYSNRAKQEQLAVPEALLHAHGAVSRQVVEAMAGAGADERTACVAVSGIAGPGGGSAEKPVGTVWIAAALPHEAPISRCFHFRGSRAEVRTRSVLAGFSMLIRALCP